MNVDADGSLRQVLRFMRPSSLNPGDAQQGGPAPCVLPLLMAGHQGPLWRALPTCPSHPVEHVG